MRNLAISLLLAESASAQKGAGKKDGPMARDYAVPAPVLIADAWSSDGCVDATVTAANTKVTTADAAWKKLVAEKVATQDAAVTTAVAEKKTAVDAVIAKDKAMAPDVKTDDTAQQKELTLKQALDTATYTKNTKAAEATAAATAKTAADAALSGAQAIQTAMNTAKTNAGTHYTAEQGQTAAKKIARGTADSTHTTEKNKITGLESLYTTAKGLYDTKKTEWDTKKATKSWANQVKAKINTENTAAAAAILEATNPSVAKTLKDAKDTLTATQLAALNIKTTAWQAEGKKVTTARKGWDTAEGSTGSWGTGAWVAVGSAKACSTSGVTFSSATAITEDACKTNCKAALASKVDTNTLPVTGGTGAGHCFGIDYTGGNCKLLLSGLSALAADAGAGKCFKRGKAVSGADYVAALLLAKSDAGLHTAYISALTAWNTQNGVVADAQGKVNIATQYKSKVDTDNSDKNGKSTTADSEYTTANGQLAGLNSDMTTKQGNLNTQVALVATKKAEWDKLIAEVTAQEAEEAAQLAIKTLAEGDKTAQDGVVNGLTTAATAAAGAKTTADTAKTTATSAWTTAQGLFDTQVTVAAGTATALTAPLAAIKTLREAAATKTTALDTAITNQKSQAALIVTSQGALGTAKAELLAAVVACKEAEFDKYKKTLATAEATRAANLKTIEDLVAKAKAEAPARGKAGARCEKALSNGTMRPKRGEGTCDTGLCCGAAKVPVGKAMMTIETCQPEATKKYSYSAPRAPMQTTPGTGADYVFVCIQGAKKVAATASALAAALYMMA